MKNISDLSIGSEAEIVDFTGSDAIQSRLHELGLIPGVLVKLIRIAPLGDPIEIEILGYNLSLRKSEASLVQVKEI